MMANRGFTLIELLIYLACSVGFVYSAGYLYETTYQAVTKSCIRAEISIELALAMDMFMNDITSAEGVIIEWKEATPQALIFNNGSYDIGWVVKDAALFRLAGSYSITKKLWTNHSNTLVVRAIHSFSYSLKKHKKKVKAVACTFTKSFKNTIYALDSLTAVVSSP